MSLPLDDKALTRGYALLDDLPLVNDRVLLLQRSLSRLLAEGALLNLRPRLTRDEILSVLKDMIALCRQVYGDAVFSGDNGHKVRVMLTGGGGDFGVAINVFDP